ncbi:alpha/beta fold hydrolase [Streptomyces aidingensis]|uniref:3-oxoadipate enol-lactonase n=1 Tax=Streptomyces aidingensis TaxID=910347 RepID=A0A1I1N2A2_9ACTN|nr:alpha/beta hydrolase [Streptomyces aidingensis]SFC91312.1 3-oxoadipate enol-lactonase [Streptomyces aidingensis]
MSTIAMKQARLVNGLTLPYAEAGYPGGVPVVFVHGLGESWASFEQVLRRLPTTLHGWAPTQRGHRDASRPDDGYRPEDFAADLVSFLDAAGIGRAVLVGASSGGVAARMVAGSHPDRVAGLVLCGVPATLEGKPGVAELGERIALLRDPLDQEAVEPFVSGLTVRPVAVEFLDRLREDAVHTPAGVWQQGFRGLLETDLPATLGGILVPTMVLWGDRDTFVPRADQEQQVKAVHGSRLVVYEGTGHCVHWEEPGRVTADLAGFAADLGLTPS